MKCIDLSTYIYIYIYTYFTNVLFCILFIMTCYSVFICTCRYYCSRSNVFDISKLVVPPLRSPIIFYYNIRFHIDIIFYSYLKIYVTEIKWSYWLISPNIIGIALDIYRRRQVRAHKYTVRHICLQNIETLN